MDFSEMGNRSWRVIVKPRACFFCVQKRNKYRNICIYHFFVVTLRRKV